MTLDEIKKAQIEVIPSVYSKDKINNKIVYVFSCKMCGKLTRKSFHNKNRYYTCKNCTREALLILRWGSKENMIKARMEKTKKNNLAKYGVEYVSQNKEVAKKISKALNNSELQKIKTEKAKETNLEKYGGFSPMCNKEVQQKKKEKSLKKYGVEDIHQTEEYREKYSEIMTKNSQERFKKIKSTNLKKYGYESAMKNQAIKEKHDKACKEKNFEEINKKVKSTNLKRYGVEFVTQNKDIYQKGLEKKRLTFLNKRKHLIENFKTQNCLGFHIDDHYIICNYCNNKKDLLDINLPLSNIFSCSCQKHRSIEEKELAQFIESLGLNIERNKVGLLQDKRKEIDIWIPNKNIGIEFDGIYYHADGTKKDFEKFKQAQTLGIKIINVWSNEWENKKDLVKATLKSILLGNSKKYYARKGIVKEIDNATYKNFCENNHLQGSGLASIRLGFFINNELLEIMSFSKSRFNKNYQYEIMRECSKIDTQVVGGKSKLFNYFIKNYNPKSIISYCDQRYFNGNSYLKLGMTKLGETKPNYYYYLDKTSSLYSRIKFQKYKLNKLLINFDPKLSEQENMILNGYKIIFDCGQGIFSWIKNE
jgi:hypothetical protein